MFGQNRIDITKNRSAAILLNSFKMLVIMLHKNTFGLVSKIWFQHSDIVISSAATKFIHTKRSELNRFIREVRWILLYSEFACYSPSAISEIFMTVALKTLKEFSNFPLRDGAQDFVTVRVNIECVTMKTISICELKLSRVRSVYIFKII